MGNEDREKDGFSRDKCGKGRLKSLGKGTVEDPGKGVKEERPDTLTVKPASAIQPKPTDC
jgi:hypothetical protein